MALTDLVKLAAAAELGLAATMTAAWAVQRRTGNSGWIDAFWTFGVGAFAAILSLVGGVGAGLPWRQVLVVILAALWSLRLGAHIVARTRRASTASLSWRRNLSGPGPATRLRRSAVSAPWSSKTASSASNIRPRRLHRASSSATVRRIDASAPASGSARESGARWRPAYSTICRANPSSRLGSSAVSAASALGSYRSTTAATRACIAGGCCSGCGALGQLEECVDDHGCRHSQQNWWPQEPQVMCEQPPSFWMLAPHDVQGFVRSSTCF